MMCRRINETLMKDRNAHRSGQVTHRIWLWLEIKLSTAVFALDLREVGVTG